MDCTKHIVVLRKVFGPKRVEVMGVDETTQGSP